MALVILDPNLEGEAGHHLAYDLAIAEAAMARGETTTIIANRRFPATTIGGVRITPHFSETCYASRHDDPVTGRFDDFRHYNDVLSADLALLPRAGLGPGDAVLVPTVTETHLAAYVGWMKGFAAAEAPLFLIHLMLPSGYAIDRTGRGAVEDPMRALFYRLAERAAREAGPEIHLFASGGQHAAEYTGLVGREVPAHPLPIRPEPAPRPATSARALLFAGDARLDKGIGLLPGLVPRLAEAHPDWTFVAHVNTTAAWGEAKAAGESLAGLKAGIPNLAVTAGRLSAEAYHDLLRGVRLALFPYDPLLYRRKSSGVLWEAISLGLPVVVPADTWLENEARHWGAGHVTYPAHEAGSIATAFAEALPRIGELEARSAAAGARYRAANGAAALMDQIAALWVRHKATARLVARPRSATLDLARLEAGWHRLEAVEGTPARWSAQEPVIAFDWPFEQPWEVEAAVLSFFGAEQLDRIEVLGAEAPVTLTWARDGRGARLRLRGAGPGRARPRVELRLRLPFTYRPPNDARDLGLLVGGLRIGPAAAEGAPAEAVATLPAMRVTGPAAGKGGWRVAPAVSGEVEAAPDAPPVLAFRLRGASVPALRALVLYVDGVPVPLALSAEEEGLWLATAPVPAALLRQGGGLAAWDLLAAPEVPGEAPLLLSVDAAATAGQAAMPRGGGEPEAVLPPMTEVEEPPPEPPAATGGDLSIRWESCAGIGPEEGPFPDLDMTGKVRWIVAREARLALEAAAAGPRRLRLVYRCLLPRQPLRVALADGAAAEFEARGGRLQDRGEMLLDLALQAGLNEVRLQFGGSVREPGSGRELVLLIERLDPA